MKGCFPLDAQIFIQSSESKAVFPRRVWQSVSLVTEGACVQSVNYAAQIAPSELGPRKLKSISSSNGILEKPQIFEILDVFFLGEVEMSLDVESIATYPGRSRL